MRYHNITKDDMKNGEGLRVVLWVSGCSHRCKGCQNPITWDPDDGLLFDDDAKKEIYDQLDKDYISGITLSGGDPLFYDNRYCIMNLVKDIKNRYPDKTIWMYTGYKYESICNAPILLYVDVLVDGRYEEDLRDTQLPYRGSSNQRIIDVNASRILNKVVLYDLNVCTVQVGNNSI